MMLCRAMCVTAPSGRCAAAYTDLTALHRELDEAVADCYGWPKAIAQDDRELVRRLTELNCEIATGERPYASFTHLEPEAESS